MDLFGRAELFGVVPVPIVWLLGWGVPIYLVLHRTAFGVKVFATGDNREAADLAGIKTMRVKQVGFLITALAAGLSAIISLSFLKTVTPTQGTGLELEAIAASVIGGTAMSGGVGSILGTFLGHPDHGRGAHRAGAAGHRRLRAGRLRGAGDRPGGDHQRPLEHEEEIRP